MSTNALLAKRYQLEDSIGEGGMGTVYRAMDTRLKRHVAIKQLKRDIVEQDPDILERFRREAQALRRLNHPNIVRVMGIFSENDDHYIVMEYLNKGSIADLMATQEKLPIERIVTLALELSDALARAHHLNIIHRDIKPGNVLIADDGTARLTDFGIARLGDRSRVTQAHTVLGTLAYLSPEALDGRDLDARADIWAFGVLLYKMITGELPFEDTTTTGTIMAIFTKPIPPITDMRDDVPPELVTLLERMLEKDVEMRISNIRLVGAELHAILQGEQSMLVTTPPQTEAVADVGQFVGALQALIRLWVQREREAQNVIKNATDGQTLYYQRAISSTYETVIRELQKVVSGMDAVVANDDDYAEVTGEAVAELLKKTGMRYNNLYEDAGYIFTAVFPKMPIIKSAERIEKLEKIAPQIVILEKGKLDSGEPYLDFAFESPL